MISAALMIGLVLILAACDGLYGPDAEDVDSHAPVAPLPSPEFCAYDDVTPDQAIAEIRVVRFQNAVNVDEAIRHATSAEVGLTHLEFRRVGRTGSGAVATLEGVDTDPLRVEDTITKGFLQDAIDLEITLQGILNSVDSEGVDLTELRVNTENEIAWLRQGQFEITGYQAVIPDARLAVVASLPNTRAVERVYDDDPTPEMLDEPASRAVGTAAWEPDAHSFKVLSDATDGSNRREFYWTGTWMTGSRISAFRDGPSPAFEPDITMRFKVFLGFPTKGWVEPNPRSNGHYWASNMPNAYLDTQTSDGSERAYTVGSTGAELFSQNVIYYTRIRSAKWTPSADNQKDLSYGLEHWDRSGSIESWPWSVGVLAGIFSKEEVQVISLGGRRAPYTSPTY